MKRPPKPRKLLRLLAGGLLLTSVLAACAGALADPSAGFLPALLAIYRGPLNHLYAIRGGQCPMYPSCSQYSRQAIARHGLLIGWVMTTDRLLRCGRDETHLSAKIRVDGQLKTYDPLDANDFWWFSGPCRGDTQLGGPSGRALSPQNR